MGFIVVKTTQNKNRILKLKREDIVYETNNKVDQTNVRDVSLEISLEPQELD